MKLPPVSPAALAVADAVIKNFPGVRIGMTYPSGLPENSAAETEWVRHQVAAVLQGAMAAFTVSQR